jgi:hypothetical protein
MSSTVARPSDSSLRAALRLALLFAGLKLLLQFALTLWTQHIGYSYFRDEFYYIACGGHLAWGFVDHGPIVALQARLGELLFGDSLFSIRILSALAGAATVFLTGLLAWALGGLRPAQALAMLGVLVAPIYIAVDGFLSMNSFEPVFWMLCALALIRLIEGARQPFWWIIFGLSAGIGLLNKPSILFFLIAAGIGLLLTPQRRILFTRWAALGIGLIIIIALPYVLWQIHNHWPTLEFFHNGKLGNKNVILGPGGFFLAQLSQMHPSNALLWITGLISLLRARSIPRGRWIGLTFLVFYVLMFVLHAKDYYLAPIYPALFAAGAIAWERRFASRHLVATQRVFAFPIFESALILSGLLILPMSSPILRPAAWVRYTTALHLKSGKTETASSGELPQFYADRFGWQQQVTIVARTFNSLSPADQRRVCIFAVTTVRPVPSTSSTAAITSTFHLPSADTTTTGSGVCMAAIPTLLSLSLMTPRTMSQRNTSQSPSLACARRPTQCLSSTVTSTSFAAAAPPRPPTGPTSATTIERYLGPSPAKPVCYASSLNSFPHVPAPGRLSAPPRSWGDSRVGLHKSASRK